jgi:hypothetical protein
MAQVWTMNGLHHERAEDDPLGAMMSFLDEEGFTSVVATNSEQTYHRYLRHGEHVSASSRLECVAGPKRTALGEGWFVTTRTTWYVGEEAVADMVFRVLKYRPPGAAREPVKAAAPVLRPVISKDTEFFWAGTRAGELRIQRWGETLRHPPGPCHLTVTGISNACRTTWWSPAVVRSTATSYITTRRCPGRICRSWSHWWW